MNESMKETAIWAGVRILKREIHGFMNSFNVPRAGKLWTRLFWLRREFHFRGIYIQKLEELLDANQARTEAANARAIAEGAWLAGAGSGTEDDGRNHLQRDGSDRS